MKVNKKQFYNFKNNSHMMSGGFTLVEVMVSLMIFLIVVLASVGSLYSVNNASRKAQAMRSVQDNLTFGIESMSRTIRTGNYVVCGGNSNTSGDNNCVFAGQSPSDKLLVASTLGVLPAGDTQLVEYQLARVNGSDGTIQKRVQQNGVWSNWLDITAPEINVQELSFYVDGANPTDQIQPNVSIFIRGIAVAGSENTPFAVQTYVSQRTAE